MQPRRQPETDSDPEIAGDDSPDRVPQLTLQQTLRSLVTPCVRQGDEANPATAATRSAALTSRVMIEHATGVISERAGADLAEAFSGLRGCAGNHKPSLTRRRAVGGPLDPRAGPATRPAPS
jgi:hypothetical protein